MDYGSDLWKDGTQFNRITIAMTQFTLESLQTLCSSQQGRFFEELKDLLSFKSISTDPEYDAECRRSAEWLVSHIQRLGLAAELRETGHKPVVFASHQGSPDRPRILVYGHYDVQPVDPLDLWRSNPFEATLKGDRLYARGASDDKGQVFFILKAIEALRNANNLDCPLTLVIEGEEESGSAGLESKLHSWADDLKADILMVCDTGALRPGVPCMTMGIRGLVSLELTLGGIKHDLHSGGHGGLVKNPAVEMARLIASLHHPDGSIAIPGYYDGVLPFSSKEREMAQRSSVKPEDYERLVGVPPLGGEAGLTITERRGIRPTIEVNGLTSGYSGPGTKTIIPSRATVKITSRLVAEQNPERCLGLLLQHIERNAPKGLKLEITSTHVGGPALRLSADSPLLGKVQNILREVCGTTPDVTWEGGSIPVVAKLREISGAEPLMVGFGLEEDCIHAPNESFAWSQFRLGFLYAAMALMKL